MRPTIITILCVWGMTIFAQITEKSIKTKVDDVTVFLDGAQIIRKKTVEIPQGEAILKFVDLSPFVDAKSIQVKANGKATVLSVNHQYNFLQENDESADLENLRKQLDEIQEQINLENTYLQIIREELAFLQENRDLGGRNQELNVSNLKEASAFYNNRLTELKLSEIQRNKKIKELNEKATSLRNQISTYTTKDELAMSEILVKVNAKNSTQVSFELSYMVKNAGWFPSYDIRAKSINEPIELIYKANIHQDTKVDWNNVKLHFSSAEPNLSGVAPQLKTYYLGYYITAPTYDLENNSNQITGRVFERSTGEPLIGVNVIVDGTTIGTVTDINGNYSLTLPNGARKLNFSFIGYRSKTVNITDSRLNVFLEEDNVALEAVEVRSDNLVSSLQGRIAGLNISGSKVKKEMRKVRDEETIPIEVQKTENQTTASFDITIPYTIKSENKTYTVDMQVYEVNADFLYYAVPKIDKDVFLVAYITNWEQYSLMEGEANIFFEDTYIGKSILDVRFASDTLELSLGRDKNVSVKREKIKDYTTKQLVGSKKEVTRSWQTIVKNNKGQEIDIVVYDQVPVSTMEEIEVEVLKSSGGKIEEETGNVKWELDIKPGEQKDLELKYAVKYPKNKQLNVE